MVKLVFVLVVLMVVAATASPRPRKTQLKKAVAPAKHSAHHGLDLHARPVKRVPRNHGTHTAVHHAPGGSAHHSNKIGVRSIHGGNKGVVHRPVKNRGHRK